MGAEAPSRGRPRSVGRAGLGGVVAATAWAATLLQSAGAQPAPATPTPPAALLAACAACHGPGGSSRTAGQPSIAGQPKVFIENQLVLIREGLREVPAMKAVLEGVSDEVIVALATHYAAQPLRPQAPAPDVARQRAGAEVSRRMLCGTCHLPDYRGQNQVPRLAGQDEAWLRQVLRQFRDQPAPGRDTIMSASVQGLSDTDLAQLAHYLATASP